MDIQSKRSGNPGAIARTGTIGTVLAVRWVGSPAGYHLETLARTKLAVAYMGDGANTDDLAQVANHVAHLGTGE